MMTKECIDQWWKRMVAEAECKYLYAKMRNYLRGGPTRGQTDDREAHNAMLWMRIQMWEAE